MHDAPFCFRDNLSLREKPIEGELKGELKGKRRVRQPYTCAHMRMGRYKQEARRD